MLYCYFYNNKSNLFYRSNEFKSLYITHYLTYSTNMFLKRNKKIVIKNS